MLVADAAGAGVDLHHTFSSLHEVTAVHATLASSHNPGTPDRLIGDTAYDSDSLDAELAETVVEMIASQRRNRTRP